MNVLIRSAVCEVLLLMAPDGWVEEPVTPIGFLLINPTAMHRKALKPRGSPTMSLRIRRRNGHETVVLRCRL